jgi:tetratricopeptide (TPR) repeat protein
MFTIPIKLRFAAMAAGLILGIGLWVVYGFWYGFPFLLASIILTIGYIMLGTVQSAAMLLNQNKLAEAEAQLKWTYFPQWLFVMNRGYYYMLHGTIAMQRKDFVKSENYIQQALATGLPGANEKGAAYLQLANIAGSKQNWSLMQTHLNEAKKLDITEPMIRDQIKEFDKALKQRGQAMSPANMMGGGYRPGGKRKPPRMR